MSEVSSRRCIELVVEEIEREKSPHPSEDDGRVVGEGEPPRPKRESPPVEAKKAVAFEATSDRIPPIVTKLCLGLFRSRSETLFRFFPSEIERLTNLRTRKKIRNEAEIIFGRLRKSF